MDQYFSIFHSFNSLTKTRKFSIWFFLYFTNITVYIYKYKLKMENLKLNQICFNGLKFFFFQQKCYSVTNACTYLYFLLRFYIQYANHFQSNLLKCHSHRFMNIIVNICFSQHLSIKHIILFSFKVSILEIRFLAKYVAMSNLKLSGNSENHQIKGPKYIV